MMGREDVMSVLRKDLTALGFAGRGRNLRVLREEVAWLVELELIPRTSRVGVFLGACPAVLAPEGWPTRANDCPIILDPASGGAALLGHNRWVTWLALDGDSVLSDEARREALYRLAEALVSASERITTVSELRAAAAEGQLTGFVRKDARALLVGGETTNGGG
jgi:hypothetical protein